MDATSRQVIALHVGDRSRRSAKRLWAKIPLAYRQHAMFYTDQYVVYEGVMPAAQHRPINKLARKTDHIERFNNTLRQRASRLVRQALSFSEELANHIGARKLFICHYTLTGAAAHSGHHMDLTTVGTDPCQALIFLALHSFPKVSLGENHADIILPPLRIGPRHQRRADRLEVRPPVA